VPDPDRPADLLADTSRLRLPLVCVGPGDPREVGARGPVADLAAAVAGRWGEAHIAAGRSARAAATARTVYESGGSTALVLAATRDPQERAEIASALQHRSFPQDPVPSAPFPLDGEPGIGWWVLDRQSTRPTAAVVPVDETYAVRWTLHGGYEVLERR
jgi:hypothetical protein